MPLPKEPFSDLMAHLRLHFSTEGLIGQWRVDIHFKVSAELAGARRSQLY